MFRKTLESMGQEPNSCVFYISRKWIVSRDVLWSVQTNIITGSSLTIILQSYRRDDLEKKYCLDSWYVCTKHAHSIFCKSLIYGIFIALCFPLYEKGKNSMENIAHYPFFLDICTYIFYLGYRRHGMGDISCL